MNKATQKTTKKATNSLHRQKGFSTIQIVAGLGIAGALAGAAATVLLPAYNQAVLSSAYDEIHLVAGAVRQVRENNGDYADLANFAFLVTDGYIQGGRYVDGADENVYGEDITAVTAGNPVNTRATITYTTAEDAQCELLLDRVEQTLPGLDEDAANACAADVLTFTVF